MGLFNRLREWLFSTEDEAAEEAAGTSTEASSPRLDPDNVRVDRRPGDDHSVERLRELDREDETANEF